MASAAGTRGALDALGNPRVDQPLSGRDLSDRAVHSDKQHVTRVIQDQLDLGAVLGGHKG